VCQVPLGEGELAEATMHHGRCDASTFKRGEAECLLVLTKKVGVTVVHGYLENVRESG
jgi:hypothetical protein